MHSALGSLKKVSNPMKLVKGDCEPPNPGLLGKYYVISPAPVNLGRCVLACIGAIYRTI